MPAFCLQRESFFFRMFYTGALYRLTYISLAGKRCLAMLVVLRKFHLILNGYIF